MELARGTGVRLAGQLVGGLASLAVLPLLIRHLGVEDFGRYVAVLALIGIAMLVSDIGLTGLALRESATAHPDRRREVLASLFGLRLAVAALGGCAAIGFAVTAGYSGAAVGGTALASLGLFPQIYADMVVVGLVVANRFGAAAAIETTRSVGSSTLIVLLVVADAGLVWFLAAWAVAALLAAVVARATGGDAAEWPRWSRPDPRRTLAGAWAYALATALHVFYFRAVMLVVAGRASATQVGWFGAGFRITEFTGAAAGQASGSATPTLARAASEPAAFERQAGRVIGAAAALGIAVGAALAIAAPLVMRILGGDELEPAADVLRIQAIAAGLVFPSFAAGAALFALRRHRDMVIANATALVVAVAFAFALVPGHEARGGAVAMVCGEAVLFFAEIAFLLRAFRSAQQPA
jgi:O-antigen/teichoic acid export membrane protein